MNWPSIAIIALIVIGLIIFYALTGIGSNINCYDKHKMRNPKHLKKATDPKRIPPRNCRTRPCRQLARGKIAADLPLPFRTGSFFMLAPRSAVSPARAA